jgi:hypothetical protein
MGSGRGIRNLIEVLGSCREIFLKSKKPNFQKSPPGSGPALRNASSVRLLGENGGSGKARKRLAADFVGPYKEKDGYF